MRNIGKTRGFFIAAVLVFSIAVIIISCDDDKTVCPSPVTCPPSPPSEVYAENRDEFVYICWAPNPESDVAGYDIYRGEDLGGDFYLVGTVYEEEPDPYEYCFEYDEPANGEQYFYFVVAFDYDGNESIESFAVSATPRYEGLLKLYETAWQPDSSGYDFSSLSNVARNYQDENIDIYIEEREGIQEFVVRGSQVDIQDYGFCSSFDAINSAPTEGWAPSGRAEVIESHCYVVRLGEEAPYNYVKLYIMDAVESWARFWWAYQSDAGNTDFRPEPANLIKSKDHRTSFQTSSCWKPYKESERSTVPPSVKREGNRDLPIEPVIQNT